MYHEADIRGSVSASLTLGAIHEGPDRFQIGEESLHLSVPDVTPERYGQQAFEYYDAAAQSLEPYASSYGLFKLGEMLEAGCLGESGKRGAPECFERAALQSRDALFKIAELN